MDGALPRDPAGLEPVGKLAAIDATKVLEAVRLVRRGELYDLGRILDEHIPAFPGRSFQQKLVTSAHQLNRRRPDAGPAGWGENNVNWITEIVSTTFQLGTHLDALNFVLTHARVRGVTGAWVSPVAVL